METATRSSRWEDIGEEGYLVVLFGALAVAQLVLPPAAAAVQAELARQEVLDQFGVVDAAGRPRRRRRRRLRVCRQRNRSRSTARNRRSSSSTVTWLVGCGRRRRIGGRRVLATTTTGGGSAGGGAARRRRDEGHRVLLAVVVHVIHRSEFHFEFGVGQAERVLSGRRVNIGLFLLFLFCFGRRREQLTSRFCCLNKRLSASISTSEAGLRGEPSSGQHWILFSSVSLGLSEEERTTSP